MQFISVNLLCNLRDLEDEVAEKIPDMECIDLVGKRKWNKKFYSSTPRSLIDYNNTFVYIIENIYILLVFGCDIKSQEIHSHKQFELLDIQEHNRIFLGNIYSSDEHDFKS